MRIKPSEANTQAAVLELLAAHNIYAGRLNTGAGFVNGRPVQHHTFGKGCADILAFPVEYSDFEPRAQITPTWIECKAPGKKQSSEQISFQQHVELLGHTYLLIDNIDQIAEWLKTL